MLLQGKYVVLKAGTGSGKTLAFQAISISKPESIVFTISFLWRQVVPNLLMVIALLPVCQSGGELQRNVQFQMVNRRGQMPAKPAIAAMYFLRILAPAKQRNLLRAMEREKIGAYHKGL